MKTRNILLAIVAVAALSCKKEDIKVKADNKLADLPLGGNPVPELDVTQFAKNIENYLNTRVSGYGYTISHNGTIFYLDNGGGGWARKQSDPPAKAHGATVRQGTASVTKYITALTTVATLEKYNISLDEKLYKYLPTNWKPSGLFKMLSFKNLLAHETGLINYGREFSDLKLTVEGPVQIGELIDSTRDYDNINYDLAAIIIPYVSAKHGFPADYQVLKGLEKNPNELYKQLASRFIGQARVYVFKPAGINQWQVMDWYTWDNNGIIDASQGTLGYTTVYGNEKGSEKGDSRPNGGAGGLYCSAFEMAKIQLAAAQGKIVSAANYKRMREQRLGFDGIYPGKHGKYYWKNGGANRHETIVADFGPTQVAVFTNSRTSDIGNGLDVLGKAYDDAWEVKK
ncbi:serine hydrolase [Chitinophaga niabensis]|uniref:CubicO group peptidase, beta-lactamase class C family n=1 Tax=Chitinophaga niabensis TaxID=536979 RepID=A0A1N6G256_9BACT|nr:serine hydrolase [Chitinophaga niabensis]SIO01608.1 CubicO group peptidase, beta-lactamase class C family [Chitinophaga niabensis]